MTDRDPNVSKLRRISPPLADLLARAPELGGDLPETASVNRRAQAALIKVALADLDGADLPTTTRSLSDAMDSIVVTELARATEQITERHSVAAEIAFSVIAMGKWGARELNYYSDLDLVFVHESAGQDESKAQAAALAIAGRLLANLSVSSADGPGLNIDADLRPEGAMGPLSRSLNGYSGYYDRWGEAWELQALLKSRPVAGDSDLGDKFRVMADRIIWEEGLDVDALRSIRTLKARAEEGAKSADIKRSRGGIRDIEFSVQILQLVHGRVDTDLRVTSTLDAIAALHDNGYLTDIETDQMRDAYAFLRDLEHRIQLRVLRQTHDLPSDRDARDWLGRSLGFSEDPANQLEQRLAEVREKARDLHERLYFRPILDALVGLEDARLDLSGATVRLEALGFSNSVAATQAVGDLMSGLNRRSRVMQQMLPLMLDWLSQSPDPDLGLAQLRLLMAHTPDHSVLVTLLQNNPMAGERLCTLLGTGKLIGDLIDRIPEFIPRLADDDLLAHVRDLDDASGRLSKVLESRPERETSIGTIRRFVRRRKLRIAARDVLGITSPQMTIESLSDGADAAVLASLDLVTEPGDVFGVIAMGKWGGRELSYGSDIDLMYIHGDGHNARGLQIAVDLGKVLSEPNRHGGGFEIDADLRPEGRKGPMSRSLTSFRRYYEEWVEPWEVLALVRARPAGGDPELLDAYFDLIEPVVWREIFPREMITHIRAIKARVEAERIPPGEDPDFHLKLGPGGLSDVEFLTQLLQLRHGGARPELRVPGTFPALEALREAELLSTNDYHALHDSYLFCTRARLRLHLQSGKPSDSLPTDHDATVSLAASLGFDRTGELREQYMRYTRRARRTFETLFYE